MRGERGSIPHDLPNRRSDDVTMKKTAKRPRKIDWSRADAMLSCAAKSSKKRNVTASSELN
jgi:hypothetical protein